MKNPFEIFKDYYRPPYTYYAIMLKLLEATIYCAQLYLCMTYWNNEFYVHCHVAKCNTLGMCSYN